MIFRIKHRSEAQKLVRVTQEYDDLQDESKIENKRKFSDVFQNGSNNEWIKKPVYDPPTVDEMDVEKKYAGIVSDIENLHTRLMVSVDLPSNARQLYKRCVKLKDKIQKMRKEGLAKGGEMSIGNLAFKKLRNEGYIEKLIDIISKSYDKIYTEK